MRRWHRIWLAATKECVIKVNSTGGRTDRDVDFRGCKGHLLRGSSIFGDKERSVGAWAWPDDHSWMEPAARGDAIAIAMAALRCLPASERALQATRRDNIGPLLLRFTLHFHGSPLEHPRFRISSIRFKWLGPKWILNCSGTTSPGDCARWVRLGVP